MQSNASSILAAIFSAIVPNHFMVEADLLASYSEDGVCILPVKLEV